MWRRFYTHEKCKNWIRESPAQISKEEALERTICETKGARKMKYLLRKASCCVWGKPEKQSRWVANSMAIGGEVFTPSEIHMLPLGPQRWTWSHGALHLPRWFSVSLWWTSFLSPYLSLLEWECLPCPMVPWNYVTCFLVLQRFTAKSFSCVSEETLISTFEKCWNWWNFGEGGSAFLFIVNIGRIANLLLSLPGK